MAKQQTSKPQIKTRPQRDERRGAKPPPPPMAKQRTSKPQIKTGPQRDERRGAKPPPPRSRRGKRWHLAALLAIAGWWVCSPGADTLRERHAGVLSKAEALRLPVNTSSEELEALERIGPLLDSVGL